MTWNEPVSTVDPARSACPTRPRPRRRRSARGRCRRRGTSGRRSARTRSPTAPDARRFPGSARPAGRASQPRVRREEITPVSKPARCRPPWKRACSIFTQRFETTSSPALAGDRGRLVAVQAELHPERAAPASTASRATVGSWSARRKTSTRSGSPGIRRAMGSTRRRGSRTRSASPARPRSRCSTTAGTSARSSTPAPGWPTRRRPRSSAPGAGCAAAPRRKAVTSSSATTAARGEGRHRGRFDHRFADGHPSARSRS